MNESEKERDMPKKMVTSKCVQSAGVTHSDVFSGSQHVFLQFAVLFIKVPEV